MTTVELNYSDADPGWDGSDGSIMRRELEYAAQFPALLRRLDHLYRAIRVGIVAVTEHGRSLAAILESDPGPTVGAASAYVLSRVAVETLARGWWILDRSLTPETRVSRFLANELYGAAFQDEMAKEAGWTSAYLEVDTQADLIRKWCEELGLSCSARSVGDETAPKPSQIANALIADTAYAVNGRAIYQLSSGIVHGLSWGLAQSSYRLDLRGPNSHFSRAEVSQEMPEGAGGVVIACFIATISRLREIMGWGNITLDGFGSPAMAFLNTGPNVVGP